MIDCACFMVPQEPWIVYYRTETAANICSADAGVPGSVQKSLVFIIPQTSPGHKKSPKFPPGRTDYFPGTADGLRETLGQKIRDAASPPPMPHSSAMPMAGMTRRGSLKAKGASRPGIVEAVPGASQTIPSITAAMPERDPPRKLLA